MKKKLALILFTILSLGLQAQTNSVKWIAQTGGSDIDNCYGVDYTKDGKTVAVGAFQGVVDFDPGIAQ